MKLKDLPCNQEIMQNAIKTIFHPRYISTSGMIPKYMSNELDLHKYDEYFLKEAHDKFFEPDLVIRQYDIHLTEMMIYFYVTVRDKGTNAGAAMEYKIRLSNLGVET